MWELTGIDSVSISQRHPAFPQSSTHSWPRLVCLEIIHHGRRGFTLMMMMMMMSWWLPY